MTSSVTMMARKLTALTNKQPATPMTLINTPPRDGPAILARLAIDELSAMAFMRSSRGTRLLISEWRAVWLIVFTVPRNKTNTITCQN